ncbi:Uncharacterised protein [Mycobacteroides abscessus subsp. abscessus]|nr:Uncharacterised protein [Mycobacteroides abscessus subsp. abscessus]
MRLTFSAKSPVTDDGRDGVRVRVAWLPRTDKRHRSSSSSRSTTDSRAAGFAVIAVSTRCNRVTNDWMVRASNTSVRNSTVPPMPAGSPDFVQRSANEKFTSIRAVRVSTGICDIRRSPSSTPAAESLTWRPAKFCHASATWTTG